MENLKILIFLLITLNCYSAHRCQETCKTCFKEEAFLNNLQLKNFGCMEFLPGTCPNNHLFYLDSNNKCLKCNDACSTCK